MQLCISESQKLAQSVTSVYILSSIILIELISAKSSFDNFV